MQPNGYRIFTALAMIFVTTLVISNTIAVKVIEIGGFVLPAGIICFPISYIFGDVLTEVYGFERTRSVIWWGFGCLAMVATFYYLATLLSPASFWHDEEAFDHLFGLVPRITIGSFLAYLVGSFLNSFVMSKMKVLTNGKHLWLRTISSTIVGELIDSLIFNIIAFIGIFSFANVLNIAISGFVLKSLYEIVATPLTYAIVGWVKQIEHEDKYDKGISYNPFKGSNNGIK